MRSLLFVPAHDMRKLTKGLSSGADALIVDLEDAVPEADKSGARTICAEFVAEHHGQIPIFVRVNGLPTGLLLDDLAAVVRSKPFGIMIPKCESGRDVALVDVYLSALERRDGIEAGSTRILPIVTETAASLFDFASYANHRQRLHGMLWGGEDLAADIGAGGNRGADGRYTAPYELARTLTLLAATASQVGAIDAVYTNFRDSEGLKNEAAEALRDGFSGKAAIHPDQVPIINAAFTPGAADVAWAERVVAAFSAAPGSGAISIDGKMLDRPHYRSAIRLLNRATKSIKS